MPKFDVFFARLGYATIEADSEDEARRIGNDNLKYDDVSWDDDWNVTDVQKQEAK